MKVTLLAHTPNPEQVVAAAARLCYSSCDAAHLMEQLTPEKTASFVQMLAQLGHESPTEHVTFTFGIQGISRACSHQLVRHRIASYSQKSQRYVSENAFEYVTPPEIAADPALLACYEKAMADCQRVYEQLADDLTQHHTKALMENGMQEAEAKKAARKQANEDARFVLPNACETQIVVTMNARSLHNFFRERMCQRAQWEIRDLAWEMYALVTEVAPNLFSKAGPGCLHGGCPEGKMSCGKAKEVRARFEAMTQK